MKKIILVAMATFVTIAMCVVAEARPHNTNTPYSSSAYWEEDQYDPMAKVLGNGRLWYHGKRHASHGHGGSIVALGRQLQHEGLRVSEHPAFGGVHHVHHGHGHYAGRAIDVNIGRGVREAYSASARAKFDRLAARARASGYVVLWKVAGHFDHMHIERK
jgi:hypothetical protein